MMMSEKRRIPGAVKSIFLILPVLLIWWLLTSYLIKNISLSPSTVFLFFAFASIVFIPSPLDLLYLNFIKNDLSFMIFIPAFLGILAGQHINYFIGRYFIWAARSIIKKDSKKMWLDKIYKYESYAVFIVNLLPLPYTFFNVISGMTKYNYRKWLLYVSLALALKLLAIHFMTIAL